MTISRREMLLLSTVAASSGKRPDSESRRTVAGRRPATDDTRVRVVAFDGLALFDPRPVLAAMRETWPEHGDEFAASFQSRQFEYTWLRTLTGTYVDFRAVTDQALRFAHRATGVELDDDLRESWLDAYARLRPWPDVAPVLGELHARGYALAVLSNFTPAMLESLVAAASFPPMALLSVDAVRAYKPDPRAYALATRQFRCTAAEVAFVAFAGWDAAGARLAGMRSYWANRSQRATELLGATADVTAAGLQGLLEFVDAPPVRGPA